MHAIGETTGRALYESLKCDGYRELLGYVQEQVKVFPPHGWIRLIAGSPMTRIGKDVFCEERFEKKKRL